MINDAANRQVPTIPSALPTFKVPIFRGDIRPLRICFRSESPMIQATTP